jgi:serine/threonine protein phosphatase PrpC
MPTEERDRNGEGNAAISNGARLYLDGRMTDSEVVPFAGGRAAVFSSRSPFKEGPNEDAAAVLPYHDGSGVLVVADGAGGMPAGHEASRLTVEALRSSLRSAARDELELRPAVLNGIEEANRTVRDLGVGAATTVAAVQVRGQTLRPYHVGDSMILLSGQRGKTKFLSVSHGPVSYAVEAGLLDEKDAMNHEDRNIVSNMVGLDSMRIDVGPRLTMAPRDTLLVASDGLFDNLHTEEIVERARVGALESAAAELVEACAERMAHPREGQPSKPDDLTLIVYRLG